MRFKSSTALILAPAVLFAACANTHPLKTVGADTYQLSHTMSLKAPNAAGASNALATMAQKQCAMQDNAPYVRQSEETTTTAKTRTITLTFQCKPLLKSSTYGASLADTISRTQINYVPAIGAVSTTSLVSGTAQ